jgi:peptide/nickel transport system substrate-binding protein
MAIGVAMLVLAGCGSSGTTHSAKAVTAAVIGREPSNEVARDGGSLVVGVGQETDTWNPVVAEWAAEGALVGSSVFEPLAKQNARGDAEAYLASSWIADPTFDKWQINIRPGIKFQNGEALDATAVKLNIDTYVHGALTGQVLGPLVKDVQVTGPQTIVVNMKQPWAAFPSSYLDSAGALMMAPAMIKSKDGGATHPIGTGPFVFQSWTPGDSFKVTRNPNYWQKGEPHLDSITFRVIPDEATRVAALQSGDINMMLTTNAIDANKLDTSYAVVKDWSSEATSVSMNTVAKINGAFNPFSNIHARRALTYATNRASVAKLIGAGVSTADSPFAASSVWGLPDGQTGSVNYDPSKIAAELAAYKQETGQKSLEFTLNSTADSDTLKIDQQLQAQWKSVGITAHIKAADQAALIKQLVAGELQTVILRIFNYPDPDNDFLFWSSKSVAGVGGININFNLYKSPQIDADLAVGRSNSYPSKRKAAYDDLVRTANGAVLNDWLYRTPYSLIASARVKGLNAARDVGFGNYEPKTWFGALWLSGSS